MFYISANVTFFKSISYFLLLLLIYLNLCLAWRFRKKQTVPKSLHVFTRRLKNVVYTSLPADPKSTVIDHNSPHSPSLPTAPPLSTIEMDTYASSDLDLLIAQQKGQRSYTQHPISNFIF